MKYPKVITAPCPKCGDTGRPKRADGACFDEADCAGTPSAGDVKIPLLMGIPVDPAARRGVPFRVRPGSVIVKCVRCRQGVYLGPRQQAKRRAEGCEVWCLECLLRAGILQDPTTIHYMGDD